MLPIIWPFLIIFVAEAPQYAFCNTQFIKLELDSFYHCIKLLNSALDPLRIS